MKEQNLHTNQPCERADTLLAYLYGETTEAETTQFTAHLQSCQACQTEAATLGAVRGQLGDFRDHTLANAWRAATHEQSFAERLTPAFTATPAQVLTDATHSTSRTNDARSARAAFAALRDFFTLSPAWMRGATAFATVAIVALLAFAAISFGRERAVSNNTAALATNRNVAASPSPTYTESQVEQLVSQRVAQERAVWEAQNRSGEVDESDQSASPAASPKQPPSARQQTVLARATDPANQSQRRAPRSNERTSAAPRERELARRSASDEPPRLYDLLDGID